MTDLRLFIYINSRTQYDHARFTLRALQIGFSMATELSYKMVKGRRRKEILNFLQELFRENGIPSIFKISVQPHHQLDIAFIGLIDLLNPYIEVCENKHGTNIIENKSPKYLCSPNAKKIDLEEIMEAFLKNKGLSTDSVFSVTVGCQLGYTDPVRLYLNQFLASKEVYSYVKAYLESQGSSRTADEFISKLRSRELWSPDDPDNPLVLTVTPPKKFIADH